MRKYIELKDLTQLGFISDKPHTLPCKHFKNNLYLFAQGYSKRLGEYPFYIYRDFYKVGISIFDPSDSDKECSVEEFMEYTDELESIIDIFERKFNEYKITPPKIN